MYRVELKVSDKVISLSDEQFQNMKLCLAVLKTYSEKKFNYCLPSLQNVSYLITIFSISAVKINIKYYLVSLILNVRSF